MKEKRKHREMFEMGVCASKRRTSVLFRQVCLRISPKNNGGERVVAHNIPGCSGVGHGTTGRLPTGSEMSDLFR